MNNFTALALITAVSMPYLAASCASPPSGESDHKPSGRIDVVPQGLTCDLASMVKIGEQRALSGGGYQVELPSEYFQLARSNAKLSLELLLPRLESEDANVRANAYDFIGHIGELPEFRVLGLAILEYGERHEGLAIQNVVRPALNRLTKSRLPKEDADR